MIFDEVNGEHHDSGRTGAASRFVVSDLDGRSAGREVTACVVEALRDLEYRVAVNDPYKGGEIVRQMGSPATGVHSVQVEINRALYLDEARVEKGGLCQTEGRHWRGDHTVGHCGVRCGISRY